MLLTEQDRLIIGLLRPDHLLDMARRFIFFDKKSGKMIARYQQVQGTKVIVEQARKSPMAAARAG